MSELEEDPAPVIGAAAVQAESHFKGNHVTNIGFGGDDWSTLFLTTFDKLARIPVKVPGIPVPRGPV